MKQFLQRGRVFRKKSIGGMSACARASGNFLAEKMRLSSKGIAPILRRAGFRPPGSRRGGAVRGPVR